MAESNLLEFETDRSRDEWCSGHLHPLLTLITLEAAKEHYRVSGQPMKIGSIHRTKEEDAALGGSGMHVAWRAVDVPTLTHSWDDPTAKAVSALINEQFTYNPLLGNYKVALFDPHGTGPHIHLQVHYALTTFSAKNTSYNAKAKSS